MICVRCYSTRVNSYSSESRHLVRALLREASYLSDPYSRIIIAQRILNKARSDRNKAKKSELVARGEAVLRRLTLVNLGDAKAFKQCLAMTYGRTGKRRHMLMAPLLGNRQDAARAPVDEPVLTPPMTALVKSQHQIIPHDPSRKPIRSVKRLVADRNAVNAWFEPLSDTRLKNLVLKERAKILDRVYVPLPQREWHFLKSISLGAVSPPATVKRRVRIEGSQHKDQCFTRGNEALESRKDVRESPGRARKRARKIYQSLFTICPLLEYDESKDVWTVTWGCKVMQEAERLKNVATADTL